MKENIKEILEIPAGIECSISDKVIKCRKDSSEFSKAIDLPRVNIKVEGSNILLESSKGTKKELKVIKSYAAHIRNLFSGLQKKFTYKLEACNVHFPMTLKLESGNLIISNFLGEKVQRKAKILPDVDVEIKGLKIALSSHDKEAAGQTAANIEKATKIKNRDKRIFQDGIFIIEKPGRE